MASQGPAFPLTFSGEGAFTFTQGAPRQAGQPSQGRDHEGWTPDLQAILEGKLKARKAAAEAKKAAEAAAAEAQKAENAEIERLREMQRKANKLRNIQKAQTSNKKAFLKLLGAMVFPDVKHKTINKKAPQGSPPKITYSPHCMPAFLNSGASQGLTPKEVEAAKLIMQVNKLISTDPEFKKAIQIANIAKPKVPKAPTTAV